VWKSKGKGYAELLRNFIIEPSIRGDFLNQARRQIDASGGRPIIWVFAEEQAKMYASELFQKDNALKKIHVMSVQWMK
jgi:hypothetical protein